MFVAKIVPKTVSIMAVGAPPRAQGVQRSRKFVVVLKAQMAKLEVFVSCSTPTFPTRISPNPSFKVENISFRKNQHFRVGNICLPQARVSTLKNHSTKDHISKLEVFILSTSQNFEVGSLWLSIKLNIRFRSHPTSHVSAASIYRFSSGRIYGLQHTHYIYMDWPVVHFLIKSMDLHFFMTVYAPLYSGPSPNMARKKVTFVTSAPSSEHGSEEIGTSGPSTNKASKEGYAVRHPSQKCNVSNLILYSSGGSPSKACQKQLLTRFCPGIQTKNKEPQISSVQTIGKYMSFCNFALHKLSHQISSVLHRISSFWLPYELRLSLYKLRASPHQFSNHTR